jgi:hypothetical protein
MVAPKVIGFQKAIQMMRERGARRMLMHSNQSPEGLAHYIVPGGYVEPDVAEKIKAHPLVSASGDGLFPGNDQTWRLG